MSTTTTTNNKKVTRDTMLKVMQQRISEADQNVIAAQHEAKILRETMKVYQGKATVFNGSPSDTEEKTERRSFVPEVKAACRSFRSKHFTVSDIVDRLESRGDSVDRTHLYNAITALLKAGELTVVKPGVGRSFAVYKN